MQWIFRLNLIHRTTSRPTVHLEDVAPLLPLHSLPAWDHYYYSAAKPVEHPQAEDDYLGEGTHVSLAAQLLAVTPELFVNA